MVVFLCLGMSFTLVLTYFLIVGGDAFTSSLPADLHFSLSQSEAHNRVSGAVSMKQWMKNKAVKRKHQ